MLNNAKPSPRADNSGATSDHSSRDAVSGGRSWLADWSNSPRILLVGAIVSLTFFVLTSPKSLPPTMLIVSFVVLGTLLYCVLKLFLIATGLHARLSMVFERGVIVIGTILPVILLVMQSVGQLTLRDILTLGGLFGIGVFYISRVRRSR